MRDSQCKRKLLNIWDEINYSLKYIKIKRKNRLQIMNTAKTIAYIKKHHCSIARYGDGDFGLMLQTDNEGYQAKSPELAQALKRVFCNDSPKLLICIPRYFNSTKGCTKKTKKYWRDWCLGNQGDVVDIIRQLSSAKYCFGDSLLSRPYMDYKSSRHADVTFPLLKELWEDKEIMIVEGSKTRLGIGNDLFSNTRAIKRIIAPATNAFDHYSQIMEGILSKWNGELVILALGPTATVLASELSKKGIQALDIGHVDIEYEWYRMGAKNKVILPGKYVNEAKEGDKVSDCIDHTYCSQVILKIEN